MAIRRRRLVLRLVGIWRKLLLFFALLVSMIERVVLHLQTRLTLPCWLLAWLPTCKVSVCYGYYTHYISSCENGFRLYGEQPY